MAVRPFGLSPEQIRVLGALAEKAATTPENYPLTSNALRTACNQRSSRDPVVELDDETVKAAMLALRERELAKTVRGAGSRTFKHAHALDRLELENGSIAVLSVLMLRGPQTVGELKGRTERQHGFDSLDEIDSVLSQLSTLREPLVEQLERGPGQKESRWRHLMDAEADPLAAPGESPSRHFDTDQSAGHDQTHEWEANLADTEQPARRPPELPIAAPAPMSPPLDERLADEATARDQTLEKITARIEALERDLAELKRELGTE